MKVVGVEKAASVIFLKTLEVLRVTGVMMHIIAICALAYVASALLVDITGVLLYQMGMSKADAVVTASMTGFIYLLLMLLWSFTRLNFIRTWLNIVCLLLLIHLVVLATGVNS